MCLFIEGHIYAITESAVLVLCVATISIRQLAIRIIFHVCPLNIRSPKDNSRNV